MILTSSANANKFDALAKSVIIMKQAHLSTVSIPIERLVPHPQNPNTHDDRQIKKLRHLIKTHGYSKGSVVYQLSTHHILAGHGLVTALKAEGYTHVNAVELDIDDDKAKAFMIADNKVASDAIIDDVSLQNLINELSDHHVPALDFAFDDTDLSELADRILADSGGYQAEPQDDEIPETVEPITQAGDLWHLGKHRVLCGDSTKAEDVAKLMDGEKADMVWTDPPFGFEEDYISHLFANCDKFIFIMDSDKNHVKNNINYIDNFDRYFVVFYDVPGYLPFDNVPLQNHSLIAQYRNKLARNGNLHGLHSVIHVTTKRDVKQKLSHAKNLEIILPFIDKFSNKNEIILDLFLGSGSTLIACQKLNRVCYGMEISPAYVDVICARYVKFVGSSAGVYVTRNGEDIEYEGLGFKAE